ncbi:thioesterase family protein|uniref:Thioesterase superfamily n=1 Tax=Dendrosporobacter quercicolus TaxID=146817 RepID=A0A1G9URP4_9FIRM|nr:thioesterase family protein [Dendrosporobacter quercicolus]NSL48050.1 thioesterase family protein [Dendrosporobacter quercicolus DSM 1736]SDM62628.1 Thioesterase superfamily [Dendrosporobacter quercicolus]
MELHLPVGLTSEKSEQVTPENTAVRYGSGSVSVYATPAMIGLIEAACLAAVEPHLPAGMATVGIHVNVSHIAATPIGMQVRAAAELTGITGKKLTFRVEAFDEKEKIGEGTHQRYIIDIERFLQKTESKLATS